MKLNHASMYREKKCNITLQCTHCLIWTTSSMTEAYRVHELASECSPLSVPCSLSLFLFRQTAATCQFNSIPGKTPILLPTCSSEISWYHPSTLSQICVFYTWVTYNSVPLGPVPSPDIFTRMFFTNEFFLLSVFFPPAPSHTGSFFYIRGLYNARFSPLSWVSVTCEFLYKTRFSRAEFLQY